MKPVPCLLGMHAWSGCRCTRCGLLRDQEHDWAESCVCALCGATRDDHHQRVGCRCRVCGRALHDFAALDASRHACRRCGLVESHRLVGDLRWEDWGGWDSIGPWRAQENEYRVCPQCGYEEFVDFTGRIQT